MKTYRKTSQKWLGLAGAMCLMLSACVKTNDTPIPPFAYVSFIQYSTDAPAADLYMNDNKVNQQSLTYGNYVDYFQAYLGKRTAYIYAAGTRNQLAMDTVTLRDQGVYSLFLSNSISKPDFVTLKDTITTPTAGTANIRFVNVSPNAPAVDLAIKGGAVLVSNKAYKGYSSFVPTPAAGTTSFEVRQQGTNTVLATLSNVNILTGGVYTIWFHGLATNPGSTPLAADIITNAIYKN